MTILDRMTESPQYRSAPPQLEGGLFLTDGGIETSLIFHDGIELPDFAAFRLLERSDHEAITKRYFDPYLKTAGGVGAGFILESVTWRASADWGKRAGYSAAALRDANRQAVALNQDLRARWAGTISQPILLSGCLGPRGDGYVPSAVMSADAAQAYHAEQIGTFAETAVDLVTAATLNESAEAIGIARAARDAKLPAVISFTVETDGRLPTGESLADVIRKVDEASEGSVLYFGINCAHPTHFERLLKGEEDWVQRIRAVRANASRLSHEELEACTELDTGNPTEFGEDYVRMRSGHQGLTVLGGCCGTDHRHIEQVAHQCAATFS